MKHAALAATLLVAISINCKKGNEGDHGADGALAKKYARYRVAVSREPELKNRLATLEKGEDVDLLAEETVVTKKGGRLNISRIKLAGGGEGFIESRHLADKTIIFIEDTPAFVRPTVGSMLHVKIPRGTIAFVVGEQANWVKIYAGKVDGVVVSNQWVQGGYTADQQLLLTARIYESAMQLIASTKESDKNDGMRKLNEIAQGATIFAEMARAKLAGGENTGQAGSENKADTAQEESARDKDANPGE